MSVDSLMWDVGGILVRIRSGDTRLRSIWREVFPDFVVPLDICDDNISADLTVYSDGPRDVPIDFTVKIGNSGVVTRVAADRFRYRHVDLAGEMTNTIGGCEGTFRVCDHELAISRMLVLVLAQTAPRVGRLMLHASAVEWQGKAYVFAGDSGAGKTTIATELMGAGRTLSVDRTLVGWDETGRWIAYATPFSDPKGIGRGRTGVPIEALFFIQQAPWHELRRVAPRDAICQILKNTTALAHAFDSDKLVLALAGQLAETLICYTLCFARDADFWKLISDAADAEL